MVVIRFIDFCGRAALAIIILMIWELFMLLAFTLALLMNAVFYLFWLPYLVARSWQQEYAWGIPYERTWHKERYLGEPYNPHNTFRANAGVLLVEVAENTWWRIKNNHDRLLG